MPSYTFDAIVIGVILLSGVLALFRGFTREFLSIVAWAAAIVAGIYFFPLVSQQLAPYMLKDKELARNDVAGALVFIGVLLIVSIFSIKISDAIQDSKGGALDRSLGFAFGLARGFLLCVLAFLLYDKIMTNVPKTQQPEIVNNARLRPLLSSSAAEVEKLLPSEARVALDSLSGKPLPPASGDAANEASQPQTTTSAPASGASGGRARRSDPPPAPAAPSAPGASGSGSSGQNGAQNDRQRLDALSGAAAANPQPAQSSGGGARR